VRILNGYFYFYNNTGMINYEIRAINIEEEYLEAELLLDALHQSEKKLNDKTADWQTINKDYMQHIIECQKENFGIFLLATINKKAVGFIFGYIEENDNSNFELGEGDDLYVSEGYVMPEYRRLGIYAALNKQFENSYLNFNVRRIVRYTLSANTNMQAWLSKQGYSNVRLVYEKWL
jgi:ribosomal protein S18 acetylase RimI-like enzyme